MGDSVGCGVGRGRGRSSRLHSSLSSSSSDSDGESSSSGLAETKGGGGGDDGGGGKDDGDDVGTGNGGGEEGKARRGAAKDRRSTFPPWSYEDHDFFRFEILYESKISMARVGRIHTPHSIIDTPGFVAVGTNAALKVRER